MDFHAALDQAPKQQLRALTGLRIIAASMIVCLHCQRWFALIDESVFGKLALTQGVSLFFVLSGFILTYNHPMLADPGSGRRFVLLRLARVWPVHAFMAFVWICYFKDSWAAKSYVILPNLLLVQSWIPNPQLCYSLNPVSWSLSTELFFYLSFPYLSRVVRLRPGGTLLALASAVALAIALCGCYLQTTGTYLITAECVLYASPISRLFEFAVGITTAHLFLRYRGQLAKLDRASIMALELLVVGAAVLEVGFIRQVYPHEFLDPIAPYLFLWIDSSGGVFIFAALIYFLANERGLANWILSKALFVWLGEISYSIYLLHVFCRVQFFLMGFMGLRPHFLSFLLFWVLLCLSAHLLHGFIERPARSFLGKRIRDLAISREQWKH